jgi:hypothetical protein
MPGPTPFRTALLNLTPGRVWMLWETSGTVAADASSNQDGEYIGSPTLGEPAGSGDIGARSVLLNGTDQFVRQAAAGFAGLNRAPPFTLAAAFKTTSTGRIIVAWDRSNNNLDMYRLGVTADGFAAMLTTGSDAGTAENLVSAAEIDDGEWHTIVGVWGSTTDRRLYVDGVRVATGSGTQNASEAGTRELSFGYRTRNWSSAPWNGWLAGNGEGASGLNKALTDQEVEDLHAAFLETGVPGDPPGEISDVAVAANGYQLLVTLDGMNGTSITGFEAGKGCSVTVTTESDEGNDTEQRTFAARFLSASGDSPATVILETEQYIYADDTGVSVTIDDEAFSDGSDLSQAFDDTIDNDSELPHSKPTCVVVSRTLYRETGEFYVDVVAVGPAIPGHLENFGLARVDVTVTPKVDGTPLTAVTKSATSLTLIDSMRSTGTNEKWQAWRIGPFDPRDDGDWGSSDTTGLCEIQATAVPRIGDAEASRESPKEWIYLDPDDAFDMRHCVVSETGDDDTGRIGTGDGSSAIESAAASNPYATLHKAISDMQRGDGVTAGTSHGTASFCVVYLEEGEHELGEYAFGERSNTSLGPVLITRHPSASRAETKIVGSTTSGGIRTIAFELRDLTIESDGSGATIQTAAPAAGTDGPMGDFARFVLHDVDCIGIGMADDNSTWVNGFPHTDGAYVYGLSMDEAQQGIRGRVVRDSSFRVSVDCWNFGSDTGYGMYNNDVITDRTGRTEHSDVFQSVNSGTVVRENINFYFNRVHSPSGASEQIAPFANNQGTERWRSVAFVGNAQIMDATTQASNTGNLSSINADGVYFYHNTTSARMRCRGTLDEGLYIYRNIWGNIQDIDDPEYGIAGKVSNHSASDSSVLRMQDTTTGKLVIGDLLVDPEGADGDIRPDDADLLNRWDEPLMPFDFYGAPMPDDGSGAIGAAQAEDGPPPEPGTLEVRLGATVLQSPATVAFGNIPQNSEPTRTLTLEAVGGPVEFTGLDLSSMGGFQLVGDPPDPQTIEDGNTLSLTFEPISTASLGPITGGTVVIESGVSDEFTVNFTGTVVEEMAPPASTKRGSNIINVAKPVNAVRGAMQANSASQSFAINDRTSNLNAENRLKSLIDNNKANLADTTRELSIPQISSRGFTSTTGAFIDSPLFIIESTVRNTSGVVESREGFWFNIAGESISILPTETTGGEIVLDQGDRSVSRNNVFFRRGITEMF